MGLLYCENRHFTAGFLKTELPNFLVGPPIKFVGVDNLIFIFLSYIIKSSALNARCKFFFFLGGVKRSPIFSD